MNLNIHSPMTIRARIPSLGLMALLFCSGAIAQDQINFQNIAEKEETFINEDGEPETRLIPAELVVPGEVIVFTSRFTNIGTEVATNLVINNPVPENVVYIDFSARGDNSVVLFSVDGETFGAPNELTVSNDQGGQRSARAEDYSAIRWELQEDLEPGETGEVSFRARLL